MLYDHIYVRADVRGVQFKSHSSRHLSRSKANDLPATGL